MKLLYVYNPFAVAEDENGDYLIGRIGEDFAPIPIPVDWGATANLSQENIKSMTYQVYPDTDDVTLPMDQYDAAVDNVLRPRCEKDQRAVDAIQSFLRSITCNAISEVHKVAEDEVRAFDLESISELVDMADSKAEWDDCVLTLDYAVQFIADKTNLLTDDEIRDILRTDYKEWFTSEEDQEEIAEYGRTEDEETVLG